MATSTSHLDAALIRPYFIFRVQCSSRHALVPPRSEMTRANAGPSHRVEQAAQRAPPPEEAGERRRKGPRRCGRVERHVVRPPWGLSRARKGPRMGGALSSRARKGPRMGGALSRAQRACGRDVRTGRRPSRARTGRGTSGAPVVQTPGCRSVKRRLVQWQRSPSRRRKFLASQGVLGSAMQACRRRQQEMRVIHRGRCASGMRK